MIYLLGRQGQPLECLSAVRDPDNAFGLAPFQQSGGRGVQGSHGEGAQIVPVGEAQQAGRLGTGADHPGLAPGEFDHHVDGLQAAGIRLGVGQPDQLIIHTHIECAHAKLPQHGVHAGLGYLEAVLLKPSPHQGVELPPPDTLQRPQRLQDEFLLCG